MGPSQKKTQQENGNTNNASSRIKYLWDLGWSFSSVTFQIKASKRNAVIFTWLKTNATIFSVKQENLVYKRILMYIHIIMNVTHILRLPV